MTDTMLSGLSTKTKQKKHVAIILLSLGDFTYIKTVKNFVSNSFQKYLVIDESFSERSIMACPDVHLLLQLQCYCPRPTNPMFVSQGISVGKT